MTVTSFDAVTARRAGNSISTENGGKVLRDPEGRELARIPQKGGGGQVTPTNTVTGNCGSSFFYLYDTSGASFAMRTGFSVPSNAFDFDWYVNVRGENSFQTDNWDWSDAGPMWPSTSWTSGYVSSTQDTVAGTYYYGRVTYGQAFLVNGAVCTSGYPNDGKWLYK